ncbi:hypothetical protein [uncultured Microbulbifer sp.]|uniref:hypothetical protein n=1 Tax=uncultured Microbulbifer sp. TaxID=348147 RepID=UPI002614C3A9|nr:hypothetical protein [uncultured Microbulbifer sp.]
MMFTSSNDRKVVVLDLYQAKLNVEEDKFTVVLLTAWSESGAQEILYSGLIEKLLSDGVANFVCVGKFSEYLHDEIDELIYHFDEKHGTELVTKVVTTFHEGEALEDSVNYFIYGSEIHDRGDEKLLAVLNLNHSEDSKVVSVLKSA